MKTQLTKGEQQVAELIRSGKAAKDIADQLNIAVTTVYKHTSNIHKKTKTTSFTQIAIDESFKVNMSDINSFGYTYATLDAINNTMSTITTGNSLNSISYFDLWSKTSIGEPKITPSIDNPKKWDMIMFIYRNSHSYNGGKGEAKPGGFTNANGGLLSYGADTYTLFGSADAMPFNMLRHEYCHLIFGNNDFHVGGVVIHHLEIIGQTMAGGVRWDKQVPH